MSEERLREHLTALTADVVAVDLATPAVHRARRRAHVWRVATGAVAVAVAGVVGVLVLQPFAPVDESSVPPSAHATAAMGIPDSSFVVAAPLLALPSGPGSQGQPACTPSTVTARAEMRHAPDGAVGVVELRGAGCSLMTDGPTALLDEDGHVLTSAADPAAGVNAAQNARSDIPLITGAAGWGWSWSGSWCGRPATAVVVPLRTGDDLSAAVQDLVVPVGGPAPACRGDSNARMLRGVPARIGDPALSGPPLWAGLRLSLATVVPDGPSASIGLRLTVSNPTSAEIVLEPCAHYGWLVETEDVGGGRGTSAGRGGTLPCGARVPARGSAVFPLAVDGFDLASVVPAGSTRTVSVAIAGVREASVQVP